MLQETSNKPTEMNTTCQVDQPSFVLVAEPSPPVVGDAAASGVDTFPSSIYLHKREAKNERRVTSLDSLTCYVPLLRDQPEEEVAKVDATFA